MDFYMSVDWVIKHLKVKKNKKKVNESLCVMTDFFLQNKWYAVGLHAGKKIDHDQSG